MARIRHLKNAPITEALLDIRVKARPTLTVQHLKPLAEELQQELPVLGQITGVQAVFEFKEGSVAPSETSARELRGYVLRSKDGLTITQVRVDGFTFHRLKPYPSWEEIFPQALKVWARYTDVALPDLVSRLAVRYINHLRLPGETIEFDDYLTAGPKVPDELPQMIGNFLIRSVIHDPVAGLAANVIQAFEPSMEPGSSTVILDIDAYKVGEWTIADPRVSETFDLLHVFKNRLFFGYITEATARLFE